MSESESAVQTASDRQSETERRTCPECGVLTYERGVGTRGPYVIRQKHPAQECQAIRDLRAELKPGDTLYTKTVHTSRSGMLRKIAVYLVRGNEPLNRSYDAAHALGWPLDRDTDAVRVSGCGMDMGFHLVYELSRVLFPKGYALPAGKKSNDKSDPPGHSNDGGYALKQRWL